ncbi:hypothetical protein [Arenimonas fontis]|uniref:Uncharacterized protein n=1 Tax=Arenimonas fontis TaxID=2608255 RepID=A0A5B2ZD81_9GAMM|nr:hypothetical protein [Arenimonas fontis]KAA2286116.1 hypothetical protein F0415_01025 [Arenimonas fontis]
MNPKFKTNLVSLAVALGAVTAGYALGQPPSLPTAAHDSAYILVLEKDAEAALEGEEASRSHASRGAMRRHLAMPFVSIAALKPRRES